MINAGDGTPRRWKRNGIRPPGIIHAQIDCMRALGNSEHGIVHSVRSALFRARTIIYGRSSEAREHYTGRAIDPNPGFNDYAPWA